MNQSDAAKIFNRLGPWSSAGLLNAIIDTPAGSTNKFKLDDASGLFKLSRTLPSGLHFPCNFGFIPGTTGDDGDALDVAVLGVSAVFVGCLMSVRLLGVIKAVQWEKGKRVQNDRLVAVPVTPVNRPRARRLADIDSDLLNDLEQFFEAYNRAQGRRFEITRRLGTRAAMRIIGEGTVSAKRSATRTTTTASRS